MNNESRRGSRLPLLLTFCLAATAFLLISFRWANHHYGPGAFWDAKVYAVAIERWIHHVNPYAMASGGTPLGFVYPPVFLIVAGALRNLLPLGMASYLAVLSLAFVAIPWMQSASYINSRRFTPAVAMLLLTFLPYFDGENILATGNVGIIAYSLILLAGIPGVRRNEWRPFYVAIVLTGLIKPPYLVFLLLPLLIGEGQLVPSAFAAVAVGLAYLAQWLLMPSLYAEFQRAVWYQVAVLNDGGVGMFWFYDRLHFGSRISWIAAVSTIAVLVLVAYFLRGERHGPVGRRLWIPMVLVLAALANPRMLGYDSLFALVPAFFILADSIMQVRSGLGRSAATIGCLLVVAIVLLRSLSLSELVFLMSSVVVALIRLHPYLSRSRKLKSQVAA